MKERLEQLIKGIKGLELELNSVSKELEEKELIYLNDVIEIIKKGVSFKK